MRVRRRWAASRRPAGGRPPPRSSRGSRPTGRARPPAPGPRSRSRTNRDRPDRRRRRRSEAAPPAQGGTAGGVPWPVQDSNGPLPFRPVRRAYRGCRPVGRMVGSGALRTGPSGRGGAGGPAASIGPPMSSQPVPPAHQLRSAPRVRRGRPARRPDARLAPVPPGARDDPRHAGRARSWVPPCCARRHSPRASSPSTSGTTTVRRGRWSPPAPRTPRRCSRGPWTRRGSSATAIRRRWRSCWCQSPGYRSGPPPRSGSCSRRLPWSRPCGWRWARRVCRATASERPGRSSRAWCSCPCSTRSGRAM